MLPDIGILTFTRLISIASQWTPERPFHTIGYYWAQTAVCKLPIQLDSFASVRVST